MAVSSVPRSPGNATGVVRTARRVGGIHAWRPAGVVSQVVLTAGAVIVAVVETVSWIAGDALAGRAAILVAILAVVFGTSARLRLAGARRQGALLACVG